MLGRIVPPSRAKSRVLFINSPLHPGADTFIHTLLLRNLPRAEHELFAAGQSWREGEAPSPAFAQLSAIPDVHVRANDYGPSLNGLAGLTKLREAIGFAPAFASLLELARYIREQRIQILHATDRPRDALACALLGKLTGAKTVIHVHVKFDTWMGRGVRWAFANADRVVGVSQFVARSLIAGGYSPSRVRAVLNAIEIERWNPELGRLSGREALGVASDVPLVVSVSRLFSWKGHDKLIRALALVKPALPDVRLAIVGSDYPEGSGTTEALKQLARELGVAENVMFMGQRGDVSALLAASDVFALASYEEPFGLVFAEAMAMKRPVVALASGGAGEVVDHGQSGLLSAPDDIAGLAKNLQVLLQDEAMRRRFGEHGRARVEARFHPRRMAADVAEIYRELL